MRGSVFAAFLLFAGSSATRVLITANEQAREKSLETEWDKYLQNPETKKVGYKSPIQRVMEMLTKMKEELEQEAANEAAMYDKMVCWCETTEKEKTKAIADGEAKDELLTSTIEGCSARFGQLATEIDYMKKQIVEDTDKLKTATAIRENEQRDFREEEKDMVQAIANLKNAIRVLGRGRSFLQLEGDVRAGISSLVRGLALKHDEMIAMATDRQGKSSSAAFLQVNKKQLTDVLAQMGASDVPMDIAAKVIAKAAETQSSAFLQTADHASGPSDGIFGIMNQMNDDFNAQLKTLQTDEQEGAAEFEQMAAAKKQQIESGKQKLDDLQSEHASNQKKLSDAKEDLEITRKQRTEDVEFLRNLKTTCGDLDAQWAARSKTRSAETQAVAEALAIMTDDDNKELLDRSVTFLQFSATEGTEAAMKLMRQKAAERLMKLAQQPEFEADDLLAAWDSHNGGSSSTPAVNARARLSTLAVSMQTRKFDQVVDDMHGMIDSLKQEQKDEVQAKSDCQEKLNENEKTLFQTNQMREDLEAKIEELNSAIAKLGEEIEADKKATSETNIAVKKASQAREEENKEFQTTIADQRATQTILKKVLTRLEDFYKKGKGALIQKTAAKQTPPVQFGKQKSNAGASPVMGMIEQIIGDSAALVNEATTDEYKAQTDYERYVNDCTKQNADRAAAIRMRFKTISDAKLEKADAQGNLDSTNAELQSLEQLKVDLHDQCDWLIKNFDKSQAYRMDEVKGIEEAIAYLKGMQH